MYRDYHGIVATAQVITSKQFYKSIYLEECKHSPKAVCALPNGMVATTQAMKVTQFVLLLQQLICCCPNNKVCTNITVYRDYHGIVATVQLIISKQFYNSIYLEVF